MEIIAYLIFLSAFTYTYFFINPRLPVKWIFIGYFLFFFLSIIPVKFWVDYAKANYEREFFGQWLKIILMLIAGFTLLNIAYGVVKLIMDSQNKFHRMYGQPQAQPVKFFLENQTIIKRGFHLFYYTLGIILMAIAVYEYSQGG